VLFRSGKIYRIRGHQIPIGSRTSKGIPAINIISIEKNEKIFSILPINEYNIEANLFFCTLKGIVKKTKLTEFEHINRNGKIAITLNEGDKLFDVITVEKDQEIYIGASNGNMVRFNENQIRNTGRTSIGVIAIKLDRQADEVIGLSTSAQGTKILSVGAKGTGKLTNVNEYRLTKRNARGVRTLKINEKTGKLIYISAVFGNEDLLMITSKGKVIRFALSTINTIGRSTSGVKLMSVDENEKIKSITTFKHVENENEEENLENIMLKTKKIG
jgi:DNA gyrase subunit A